jgi:DNA-binding transcriptional regulator YiaG
MIVSNIAGIVKAEIDRLARKEAEGRIAKAKKVASEYRHEVAELKRLLRLKERELARFRKQQQSPIEADPLAGVRFSSKSVKSQRQRLGLSADDYAKLVGVSPLTILHWETGKARPRKAQLARLVAVRGISKREALQRLAELEAAAKKRR